MPISTCTLSGTLLDPSGTALASVTVRARLAQVKIDTNSNILMPYELSTTTNASGVFSLTLVQGITVVLTIDLPPNATDTIRRRDFTLTIPATGTASLSTLLTEL